MSNPNEFSPEQVQGSVVFLVIGPPTIITLYFPLSGSADKVVEIYETENATLDVLVQTLTINSLLEWGRHYHLYTQFVCSLARSQIFECKRTKYAQIYI